MTDTDIDRQLHEHGTVWREAHDDRPGVEWDVVMTPRRSRAWLAVAGVGLAVAITVPIVMVAGTSGTNGRSVPHPIASASPPSPNDPSRGSPHEYFGVTLRGRGVHVVSHLLPPFSTHHSVVSIGGAHRHIVYTAQSPHGRCQTKLDLTFWPPSGNGIRTSGQPQRIVTAPGAAVATPMAVTAPGGTLAVVVSTAYRGGVGRMLVCTGPEQIVIVSLGTGEVTGMVPVSNSSLTVDNLAWEPDGTTLLYRLRPDIYRTGPISRSTAAAAGTHAMPTDGGVLPQNLEAAPRVLPLQANGDGDPYGPVFFWHGAPSVFYQGNLCQLDGRGGCGAVVATGFPDRVDTVSSDKDGEHLLLGSGKTSYRWDYGYLTELPGHLSQPTW